MEKLKTNINSIKEKTQKIATDCKWVCISFYARSVPFFKNLGTYVLTYKKQIFIATGVVILVVSGALAFYFSRNVFISWFKEESPTFASMRKGELMGAGRVGSKIVMGDLEVSLLDVIDGTYSPLEVDKEFKRIPPRGYFGAQVMIFNTSYNQKEFLLFGLTDDLGNQYERDVEIEFYLDGVRDFGPAREIYPRTIRGEAFGNGNDKAYLLFPAIVPEAKKLELTIFSETTNKKVVFDIEK